MQAENRPWKLWLMLAWVMLLAYFFAQVEIQIEGSAGWAGNLPTWRIEKHWLLDIFWGGRAMTGYHAWVFPFVALIFHFPLVFNAHWSLRAQCRIVACIMLFWMAEDLLWFVCNPAYGLVRFNPANVAWHKNWIWFAPADYWAAIAISAVLLRFSYRKTP
jgi:hypothetical protein